MRAIPEGEGDDIDRENIAKLKAMSKQEVLQELEELKANLSPKLLEKLKKMGQKKSSP